MLHEVIPGSGVAVFYLSLFAVIRWDVLHTVDVGLERATDQAIIDYARDKEYHCVTLDADFHSIIALGNYMNPSVIRIRVEGLRGKEMAECLIRVCSQMRVELDAGALVTVTERSIRIRHLPIQSDDQS